MDSDLTRYLGVNSDLNLNTTENNNKNQSKKNSNYKEIKPKNIFQERFSYYL